MKITAIGLMFLILTRASLAAEEETEFEVIGDIGLSDKYMDLTIRDRVFKAGFTTLDLSFTVAYGRFYSVLNHERSIKDDIRTDDVGLIFYSRQDYTATIGMSVWKSLVAFGGYRFGNTKSHYNQANNQFNVNSNGFFVGSSFSYTVGDYGSLGASIAVALLNGSVSLFEPFVNRNLIPDAPEEVNGNALGISLGLSWVGYLSESTSYNVRLKIHRYQFEDQDIYGGIDLSFDENFASVSIGLTKYF